MILEQLSLDQIEPVRFNLIGRCSQVVQVCTTLGNSNSD